MLCPASCGNSLQFDSTSATCRCGYSLAYTGGILDLLGTGERAARDSAGNGSVIDRRTFQQLARVLHGLGKNNIPVAVEFSAGDSAWTTGMNQSGRFRELYAIDVSRQPRPMLGKTRSKNRTHLVCQSTERLDFESGSLDVVVGRSFLRRVTNYEALLAKCAPWLKPDGAAIFYEPCIQGKIWIALLMKLMLECDPQPAPAGWDAMRRNLEALYVKDLEQSRPGEDKWIFDVDAMRQTAQAVGFSTVTVIDEDARLLTGFKRSIFGVITDRAKLARYSAMLGAFGVAFSSSAPKTLVSPMVFFVFRKSAPGSKRLAKHGMRGGPATRAA